MQALVALPYSNTFVLRMWIDVVSTGESHEANVYLILGVASKDVQEISEVGGFSNLLVLGVCSNAKHAWVGDCLCCEWIAFWGMNSSLWQNGRCLLEVVSCENAQQAWD